MTRKFVWIKKIERDLAQGIDISSYYSRKAEKKRQRERMSEVEKVKRRVERALEEARRDQEIAFLAKQRAQADFHHWETKEAQFLFRQTKIRSRIRLLEDHASPIEEKKTAEDFVTDESFSPESLHRSDNNDEYILRSMKPKYLNRVLSGYEWNKYNRAHYDHDNPPPKAVQGYKFNIFYPELVYETKAAPTYHIEKDDSNGETCTIRFSAGPPYEDIAFRIVNKEWDYSLKNGFKCIFEHGVLKLYFNFKRHPYRR